MEEVAYGTNQHTDAQKHGKLDLAGFITIFNVTEFPRQEKLRV
jgi:hypothetical protein